MPTLAERKQSQLQQSTGLSTSNLTDLEWNFYSQNSGLTPVNKYSLTDHKLAYYKSYNVSGKTLNEVERAFFSLMGAQGNDYDDLALDFYTNYGFGPKSISGLLMWLDSTNVDGQNNKTLSDGQAVGQWNDISGKGNHATQGTSTQQPLLRTANPNLLTYNQATIETDTTGFAAPAQTTIARDTSWSAHGTASLSLTPQGGAGQTDTYASPGLDTGGIRLSMVPGQTYTFLATIRLTAAQTGTLRSTARTALLYVKAPSVNGGAYTILASSPQAPNAAGVTPVSFSFTVPVDATEAFIRLYNGSDTATDVVWFDKLGLFQGNYAGVWVPPVTLPSTNKPVVQFDNVDDILATTSIAKSTDATFFVVAKKDVTGTDDRLIFWRQNNGIWISGNATTFTANARNADASFPSAGVSATPINWNTVGAIFTSGVSQAIDVNGTVSTTTSPAYLADTTETAVIQIGRIGSGSAYASSIAAILVYSRALSTSERQRVERYLKARYGTP